MRVHILGTRGNVPLWAPRYRRHAGILIDRCILLDVGERSYLRYRPTHIFVSHLHADHAALLNAPMGFQGHVYVPERTDALRGATMIPRPARIGSYRIIPVPTQHSHLVRSLGFVVQQGRRRLFYSSDLFSISPRYFRVLGHLDVVITDGSFMRRGGLVRVDPRSGRRFGHAGIPDLVDMFSRVTRRIVFAHFGSWFYENVPRARRQIASLGDGVRVIAAHDGRVITL